MTRCKRRAGLSSVAASSRAVLLMASKQSREQRGRWERACFGPRVARREDTGRPGAGVLLVPRAGQQSSRPSAGLGGGGGGSYPTAHPSSVGPSWDDGRPHSEVVKGHSHRGKQRGAPQLLQTGLPRRPAAPRLGACAKETNPLPQKVCLPHPMFPTACMEIPVSTGG